MQLAETNFKSLYLSATATLNNTKLSLDKDDQRILLEDLPYEFISITQRSHQYGQIQGLHYVGSSQNQACLISATEGKALLAVVDLRSEAETYGLVYSTLLSEENQRQVLIPNGFVYGYSILKNDTVIRLRSESKIALVQKNGIIFNDPKLDIDWLIPAGQEIISKQDQTYPLFKNHRKI